MSKNAFLKVPGHLHAVEGAYLQTLAEGKKVLEIGTHYGKSAVAMAATAHHVTSLDHYRGDSQIGAPILSQTLENVAESGLGAKISLIVADWSAWLSGPVDLEPFDFLFYDGGHCPPQPYEKDFLEHCLEFRGGIALHDYGKDYDPSMFFVDLAVDEFQRKTGRPMVAPPFGTSIVYFPPV